MKAKILLFLMMISLTGGTPFPTAAQSPVAEDGSYQVGIKAMLLTDESRDNRTLQAFMWYPAQIAKDAKPPFPPETSGAPYPLIIYSHGYGAASTEAVGNFNRWVSQGYVIAAVDHRDPPAKDRWTAFINRPLDIHYLLDQLTELNNGELNGLIDMDNIGIIGSSMGGYTAIAVSGARVDPVNFQNWCPTYADDPNNKLNFDSCSLLSSWDNLLTLHEQFDPPSTDDLWAAITDERIKAVIAIAPCFGQMFGEKGLAAATIPVFIIGGTTDHTCPYDIDSAYMYAHLGSSDRYLASLQDRDHNGTFSVPNLIPQYASAFFGLYLQGKTDYGQYLTPESADAYKDVTLQAELDGN